MYYFLRLVLFYVVLACAGQQAFATKLPVTQGTTKNPETLQCIAFSPYVGNLTPNFGEPPTKDLINALLDQLIAETPFRCITTYGVLNGLDSIFSAAQARHIKVIAILWIDNDLAVNSQSIARGIEVAKTFPDTILKLSCGNEVRTRHGYTFDDEIRRCIHSLRAAGVKQPITAIDTWWEWCNRSTPCHITSLGTEVDWIGVNIFPWWENTFSDTLGCISAMKAADFHSATMAVVQQTYPDKPLMLTEFGWPSGPKDAFAINQHTGQPCGMASKENQLAVIKETFKQLATKQWSGAVFEAFSENWKPAAEGNNGSFWGVCEGEPPYRCPKKLTTR